MAAIVTNIIIITNISIIITNISITIKIVINIIIIIMFVSRFLVKRCLGALIAWSGWPPSSQTTTQLSCSGRRGCSVHMIGDHEEGCDHEDDDWDHCDVIKIMMTY